MDRETKCRGIIHTNVDLTHVKVMSEHQHASDFGAIEVARCRMGMKERASNSRDKPGVIYAEAMKSLSQEARTQIQSA